MTTRTTGGFLGLTLLRFATGATPIDGTHAAPANAARAARQAAEEEARAAVHAPRRAGQVSFVRGLF